MEDKFYRLKNSGKSLELFKSLHDFGNKRMKKKLRLKLKG